MAKSILDTGLVERHVAAAAGYLASHYPGDRVAGQPVHTVYLSAAKADPSVIEDWGHRASELLEENRPFLTSIATESAVTQTATVLTHSPIRDIRFDFEDGYRSTGDEMRDARRVGTTVAQLPVKAGVRIPGLTPDDWRRSIAILEAVVAELDSTDDFVFTIPKFRALDQVGAAVELCRAFERAHGVSLRFELQIESPQAIVATDGTATVAAAIHRSQGRCDGLHYGTYDYSAACGIAAMHQSLDHPVADHAKAVMQAAAAQTGVWVCDGSTQVAPVGGRVQDALDLHFRLVSRSLARGYYQGWDMHPGHLVTRWLANIEFYRAAAAVAAPRLRAYIERTSDFDEPASAEALARVLVRGLDCGVLTLADTGVSSAAQLAAVVARAPIDSEGNR
nr:aldolase [Smaragdicoccus niigatensis]